MSTQGRRPANQRVAFDRAVDQSTRPGAAGQHVVSVGLQQLLIALAFVVPLGGAAVLGLRQVAREKAARADSLRAGAEAAAVEAGGPVNGASRGPELDPSALAAAEIKADVDALLRQGDEQRRLGHWREARDLYDRAASRASSIGLRIAESARVASYRVEREHNQSVQSKRSWLNQLDRERTRKDTSEERKAEIDKKIEQLRYELDRE
jgi:hypothetical protein